MKKRYHYFTLCLFAFASLMARGQGHDEGKRKNGGLYVGVQLGASQLKTPSKATQTGQSAFSASSQWSYSFGVSGGYQYSINKSFLVGGEIAYNHDGFGTITYASGNKYKISSSNRALFVTGQYNTPFGLDIFAKVGGVLVRQVYSIMTIARASGLDPVSVVEDLKPAASFGLGYHISRNFDLTLEYRLIFAENLDGSDKAFTATSETVGSNTSVYKAIASSGVISAGLKFSL